MQPVLRVENLRKESEYYQKEYDESCAFFDDFSRFKGFNKLNIIDPRSHSDLPSLSSFHPITQMII